MSEMLSIDAAAQTAFTTKWGRLPEQNAWQLLKLNIPAEIIQ